MPPLHIATFNLENLDDPGASPSDNEPTLAQRVEIMRPQLERVRADVLCLQEVHSQGPAGQRTLAALDQLVAGTRYAAFHRDHTVTVGGEPYDERNLVVLSRFPFAAPRSIIRDSQAPRPSYQFATAQPPDATAGPVGWERPILHVQVQLSIGVLHVVNLHMKSKIPRDIPGQKIDRYTWRTIYGWAEGSFYSAMQRLGQAVQVRMLIDQLFDADGAALIAVCGDFNAEANESSMRAICGHVEETGNADHAPRVLLPCENNVPVSSRYSLLHLGEGAMLDHVLASRALMAYFDHAEIHNEVLPDESGAFRTDRKFPESDHAPVVARFELP